MRPSSRPLVQSAPIHRAQRYIYPAPRPAKSTPSPHSSFTHLHPRPCRNPVRAAYMASLESQISSLRDELASVYKTQGQNAQRLLAMNETLREKEELSRIESENLRKAREDIDRLRRKVDQHNELMMEKDRTAQVSTRSPVSNMVHDVTSIGSSRRDQHASA